MWVKIMNIYEIIRNIFKDRQTGTFTMIPLVVGHFS